MRSEELKVVPSVNIRQIKECESGDLVIARTRYDKNPTPAFIAKFADSDEKYLIYLPSNAEPSNPPYFIKPLPDMMVVKYDNDYYIEVDHSKYIDFTGKSFDHCGMLILFGERAILRVGTPGEGIYGARFYDLKSGHFVDEPNLIGSVSFGSWCVHLAVEGIEEYVGNPMAKFNFDIA